MSKIPFYILCGLVCHATTIYAQDAHLICKQVGDIFSNTNGGSQPGLQTRNIQGRPGKLGRKGDRGEIGHRGPPGVVNYDRIEAAVRTSMSSDIDALTAKFNADIDALTAKFNALANNLTRIDLDGPKFCDVTYNGKCFHAILHATEDVDVNKAHYLCQNIGWNLANIYSSSHYAKIADYLRETIPSWRGAVTVWIGMTIVPQTKAVSLTSGANAELTGVRWYPNYPRSDSSWKKMGIHIDRDPSSGNRGIHNFPPTYNRYGALCEK